MDFNGDFVRYISAAYCVSALLMCGTNYFHHASIYSQCHRLMERYPILDLVVPGEEVITGSLSWLLFILISPQIH